MERSLDVAIVTRSAARLAEFYSAIVGLEPAGEVRVSGVLPDGVLKRFHAGGGSTLKILQFDVDPGDSAPGGATSDATGLRYLTIGVDDLAARIERCKSAEVEVTLPITALNDDVAIAFVRDPDGNLVELVGAPEVAGCRPSSGDARK